MTLASPQHDRRPGVRPTETLPSSPCKLPDGRAQLRDSLFGSSAVGSQDLREKAVDTALEQARSAPLELQSGVRRGAGRIDSLLGGDGPQPVSDAGKHLWNRNGSVCVGGGVLEGRARCWQSTIRSIRADHGECFLACFICRFGRFVSSKTKHRCWCGERPFCSPRFPRRFFISYQICALRIMKASRESGTRQEGARKRETGRGRE